MQFQIKIKNLFFIICITLMTCSCTGGYMSSVRKGDYVAAHRYLDRLYIKKSRHFRLFHERYNTALYEIYKAEITKVVSEKEDCDCAEIVAYLISEIPVDGYKYPTGVYGYFENKKTDYKKYVESCSGINSICDFALNMAIMRGYRTLAEKVLLFYQDDVIFKEGGSEGLFGVKRINGEKVDGNHSYIMYTDESREAAESRYKAAFK